MSQNSPVNGIVIGSGYGTLSKYEANLGYFFIHPSVSNGYWNRFEHRYSFDYIPHFKSWGATANLSYTYVFFKGGLAFSYRNKNDINKPYFSVYPAIGVDGLVFDILVGPEFSFRSINNNNNVGFKVSAHFNIPLFNYSSARQSIFNR